MYTKNKNTLTIKAPSETIKDAKQIEALCIFLGGFNTYAREMKQEDYEKYQELQNEFNATLYKLSKII